MSELVGSSGWGARLSLARLPSTDSDRHKMLLCVRLSVEPRFLALAAGNNVQHKQTRQYENSFHCGRCIGLQASDSQAGPVRRTLVAAAIFGVLLWLRLDYWTNEYLEIDSSLDRYLVLIYLTLAAGAVLTVFSLFGLIGACIKKKWLLVIYLISVVLAMCLTISSVVYGSIYRDECASVGSADTRMHLALILVMF
ncbi:hypothetical protein RRG08_039124 [Elysia crispata]|uniref:Uncharacterized protein n=1 Tax=Elysia crispata TaxID=231223 RepID=A0AAE1CK80_9GAST|nr:hypothetical protein RRG08_039124 [Elysia crispata]